MSDGHRGKPPGLRAFARSLRDRPADTLDIPRPVVALSLIIAGLVLVIWAVTGAQALWPMWVWFGLVTALSTARCLRSLRRRRGGVIDYVWSLFLLGTFWQVVIWLMTGADGAFWPGWDLIAAGLIYALRRFVWPPREAVLAHRVDALTRSRTGALDVQATELRRIERDLHDGAQARLVALSMQLGRAEARLDAGTDPEVLGLVRQARAEATAAIAELRDLARGIAPPVLADRGLEAAVNALADRTRGVCPVTVLAEIPGRLVPAVETAAYFVIAEALTNAAKHARASQVRVTMWCEQGELGLVVSDDGIGGADPDGSGITGLRQRAEAVDGWLALESPVGEGTTVRATLPCP